MSNAETLNQYIKELFDYWNGKNDDFELSRYQKKLTTKCRGIHFIKAETGQQSPRQCPDGNRHSDDGKPKGIVQRYRGKHGSGRTCYKVRGWSTGFR